MNRPPSQKGIDRLIEVMATLRSPEGCPWDREQSHMSLRYHAVEEVYELLDAIESGDSEEMKEELGDLLLQVVFHAQLARERKAFDFEEIASNIVEKLIRRHPHVFGDSQAKTVDAVWAQWEKIKRAEKIGKATERKSALDGIPKHLPALLYAEKLHKKARKGGLLPSPAKQGRINKSRLVEDLFKITEAAAAQGWSLEEMLRTRLKKEEKGLRRKELKRQQNASNKESVP